MEEEEILHGSVMGVDLGTGGVRVAIVSAYGEVLAIASRDFAAHEIDQPEAWWSLASAAVKEAVVLAAPSSSGEGSLRAVAIDGTSGTIFGVDVAGHPTTQALMYNDARADAEAATLTAAALASDPAGAHVSPSSGIAKVRWIEQHLPEAFAATTCFVHQADFIVARLTGEVGVTDHSNALKTGFDLATGGWAGWIDRFSALRAKLPRVVAPGDRIGVVLPDVAAALSLPVGLPVIAGCTDGTAAFLASGASRVGDDNTTLGTTLVFKRVADRPIHDPTGLLYCHKLGGCWLPGAASNVGGGWVRRDHGGDDLRALDEAASLLLPTAHLAYPACARGERFPFASTDAFAFCEPEAASPEDRFAANLQGTAFVERLGYEVLDRVIGGDEADRRGDVFATGGGSQSDVWMQLRADVNGRAYHRPSCHESAFGSAVLAASSIHGDVWAASRAMVRIERTFHPDVARHRALTEYYLRFRELLVRRGYLKD